MPYATPDGARAALPRRAARASLGCHDAKRRSPCGVYVNTLIGYSGFVGSTLRGQARFDALYRSTNIAEIAGGAFDCVVCAGAYARKWIANRDPAADGAGIDRLIKHLSQVRARQFVLISTVDVFGHPVAVDERSAVDPTGQNTYGHNRRRLEEFVAMRFTDHLIVRLPALVGPGLRKNIAYDFLNGNNLHAIDSRAMFQFYPMTRLWRDIRIALQAGLRLIHLTAEPVSAAEVALHGFGQRFEQLLDSPLPAYDFRTRHAALYGANGAYQVGREDSLQAIRAYAVSEPPASV